jgi:hypothetical protein
MQRISLNTFLSVISRWTFTEEQRKLIAAGADIYLELNTFINNETGRPNPLQPIRMAISDGKLHNDWVRVCLLDKPALQKAKTA